MSIDAVADTKHTGGTVLEVESKQSASGADKSTNRTDLTVLTSYLLDHI